MPSNPSPVIAAIAAWVATNICGGITFSVMLTMDSTRGGSPTSFLDILTGAYGLFIYVLYISGLFSIPAAILYIIFFWVIAKATLPRYVAAILLSALCVVMVLGTLGAAFGTSDQKFYHSVGVIYCSTFVVFNCIAVYVVLPRPVEQDYIQ